MDISLNQMDDFLRKFGISTSVLDAADKIDYDDNDFYPHEDAYKVHITYNIEHHKWNRIIFTLYPEEPEGLIVKILNNKSGGRSEHFNIDYIDNSYDVYDFIKECFDNDISALPFKLCHQKPLEEKLVDIKIYLADQFLLKMKPIYDNVIDDPNTLLIVDKDKLVQEMISLYGLINDRLKKITK